MNRFQNSLAVVRQSWNVLCANPSLAIFPVISAIATLIVSIPFIIPMVLIGMGKAEHVQLSGPLGYLFGFLYYFVTYTVVIFFNSALVTCAHQNLRGQATTPGEGIQNALRHLPSILGWALLSATVGQLLRMIQQRAGILGTIVGGIIGIAWNLAVYFVVPILVLENAGPIDALKGSVERLKRTWGEQLMLNVGMSGVGFLVMLPVVALIAGMGAAFVGGIYVLGFLLIAVTVLYILTASIIMSTLSTIFQTALYLYSTTGVIPAGYDHHLVQGAFAPRQSRWGGR